MLIERESREREREMESHKCKLCSKSFGNGRALGGHMRSHLANLPIPPKTQRKQEQQHSEPTEPASSLSSSERKEEEDKGLVYGLRENPKKSFRSIVQDSESEAESPRNPTRRRSKRTRNMDFEEDQELSKPKLIKPSSAESVTELEQGSSVSDTSAEEDVALCLMMLSRDTWTSDDSNELTQKKYQCETCKKVFKSFQALGGHRTSHNKIKSNLRGNEDESQKIHECPICYKVFGSGQALGGHKRSHLFASISSKFGEKKSVKFGVNFIDLNLPAPMEEDDFSQLEVSVVSDAEFIKPIMN